jgi:peptidoglycan/LPS O-acetylase OafA/YrhL
MSMTVEAQDKKIPTAPMSWTGRNSLPSLDGIRAVSIMIVFFSHAGLYRIVPAGFGLTLFFSSPAI